MCIRDRLYSSLFSIGIATNVIVLIAYTGVVWFSVESMSKMIYLVLGLKVFANIFMVEWLNEAVENYRFITIKTVIVRLIYVIGIFAFIHKPDDVVKYSVIIVLTDILNNLISFIYVSKRIPISFKDLEIKKHIVPLISILIISNVNLLYTQFDKMMLGQVVDKVSVTVYKTPQDITYMISNLLASIVMVAVPRLAYYNSNNKQAQYMEPVSYTHLDVYKRQDFYDENQKRPPFQGGIGLKKIKILMGIIGKGNGGLSTYAVNLFRKLDSDVFDCTFLSNDPHPYFEKDIKELGGHLKVIAARNRHPKQHRDDPVSYTHLDVYKRQMLCC